MNQELWDQYLTCTDEREKNRKLNDLISSVSENPKPPVGLI